MQSFESSQFPDFITLSWLETSVHSVTPFFKHCLHLASMTLSLLYPSFILLFLWLGFQEVCPRDHQCRNVPALQPVFSTSPHLSILIHLQDCLNMRFSLDLSPDLDLIQNLLLLIKHLWWDCSRHAPGSSLHKRFLPTGFPISENGNSNSDCSYPHFGVSCLRSFILNILVALEWYSCCNYVWLVT